MDKAYDEKSNKIVYAVESAQAARGDQRFYFRYRCICCEEYVTLAAAKSKTTTPYFKHKRGGDHSLCEAYTGNAQAVDFDRIEEKLQNHRQILYFNTSLSKLEFGIKFSAEEIDELCKTNARVDICTLPEKLYLHSTYITHQNFKPETRRFFELNKFALKYEFRAGEMVSVITAFESYTDFHFFRETLKKEKFKKTVGNVLYLETTYLVLSTNFNKLTKLGSLQDIEKIGEISKYSISGKIFYGLKISIQRKSRILNEVLNQYSIEKLESLYLLWPPSKMIDEYFVSEKDSIYVKSSFAIEEFKNTECSSYMRLKDSPCITKMSLFRKINIHEKNVNFLILRERIQDQDISYPIIHKNFATHCKVLGTVDEVSEEIGKDLCLLKGYEYYLYDGEYKPLVPGDCVSLSKGSRVVGYQNRHPRKIILPKGPRSNSKKDLLLDILRHYPKEEPCSVERIEKMNYKDYLSSYMERCKKRGTINSIVKVYLEEGRL